MTAIDTAAVLYPAAVVLFQLPPGVLYCHWYFSPLPDAVTENFTVVPAEAVTEAGCLVSFSSAGTVSVAVTEVTLFPAASVTIQRYWYPLRLAVAGMLSTAVLFPSAGEFCQVPVDVYPV